MYTCINLFLRPPLTQCYILRISEISTTYHRLPEHWRPEPRLPTEPIWCLGKLPSPKFELDQCHDSPRRCLPFNSSLTVQYYQLPYWTVWLTQFKAVTPIHILDQFWSCFTAYKMGKGGMHDPGSRNCAIFVLTVKLHIITRTELCRQGIAPGSQYSDPALEAAMLH